MKKKYLLLVFVICLSGCDLVEDAVAFLDSLFTDFFPTVWCWIMYILSATVNAMGSILSFVISPLLSLLPEYTLPTINLSSIPFLGYASYFMPISESATLIKYLLTFYLSWFVGRIILRWLKVLR